MSNSFQNDDDDVYEEEPFVRRNAVFMHLEPGGGSVTETLRELREDSGDIIPGPSVSLNQSVQSDVRD